MYKKLNLGHATKAAKRLAKIHGVTDPKSIATMGSKLRTAMNHGGIAGHISSFATRQHSEGPKGKPYLTALLSKKVDLPYDEEAYRAGLPKTSGKGSTLKLPPESEVRYFSNGSEITEEKDCGCADKNCVHRRKKTMKQLKERYLGNGIVPAPSRTKFNKELTIENVSQADLTRFLGKKALIETVDGTYYGILGTFRGNYAIFENNELKRSLNIDTITKFVCEGFKLTVNFNTGKDTTLLQEKIVHRGEKFVVTNEAGTKVLGTHDTEKSAQKQLQAIHISQAKHVHESSELLLKENIRNRFFTTEEIVHPDHEFTMTDDDIYERDQIADQILSGSGKWANAGKKLKAKAGETREEAAHRLATYIVVCKRRGSSGSGGGYEKGLFHGDDEKDSRRKRRSGRDLVKRDKTVEKRRKKETITDKRGRKVTRNVIKPGKKNVIKPQFKQAAAALRAKKKAVPAYMFRKTANLTGAEGSTRAQFAKRRAENEVRRSIYKRTN